MQVHSRARIEINRPLEEVFDYITNPSVYPDILPPLFPLAGIQSVELLNTDVVRQGIRRNVTMTDGTSLVESVDTHQPPRRHGYSWGDGIRPPLSLLVRRADAEWILRDTSDGTQVTWSYQFQLSSPLVWPLAVLIFRRFNTWMQQGLQRARQNLSPTH